MRLQQVTMRLSPQQIRGLKRLARQKALAFDITLDWPTLLRAYIDALLEDAEVDVEPANQTRNKVHA